MEPIHFRIVDLYHGDKVTSFANAAAAGVWGVIHKATTGATGRDEAYRSRRQEARDAGLLWGAYHWGTNHSPVSEQVNNFLEWSQPDAQTLVALDFEETPGNQMTLDQAREFLTLVTDRLGRRPVLYSGNLIKESLGDAVDDFFRGHRLWLAKYGQPPVTQASWERCWLWQYTDGRGDLQPNSIPGIPGDANGRLDCNSYGGTKEQLAIDWAS